MNYSFVILDNPGRIKMRKKVQRSHTLWNAFLGEMAKLRGKIFLEEGLIPPEKLASDGKLIDRFDEISTHFLCFDKDRIIGALRVHILDPQHFEEESCLLSSFEEFGYHHHHHALTHHYKKLSDEKKVILEFSKLIVHEEYRLFRNVRSQVALSLLAFGLFFGNEENPTDACFLTRGNKYKTKEIYQKVGFQFEHDLKTANRLPPFWKFGDINDLMYLKTKEWLSAEFIKAANIFRKDYFEKALTIIKER